MAWQQVKPFDQSKAGKIKNFCLANVTKGYGVPNKYSSAWEAWQNTEQHEDGAPLGVDVPVYFSYTATIDGINKNWGHIGVQLKNGKFWSDGTVYPSIGIYTAGHSPKYVGWGESVNGVKVIKEQDVTTSRKDAIMLYQKLWGIHSPTEAQKKSWTGREWSELVPKILNDKRFTNRLNGDPTSNDEAVKKSLKDKILGLVKGA